MTCQCSLHFLSLLLASAMSTALLPVSESAGISASPNRPSPVNSSPKPSTAESNEAKILFRDSKGKLRLNNSGFNSTDESLVRAVRYSGLDRYWLRRSGFPTTTPGPLLEGDRTPFVTACSNGSLSDNYTVEARKCPRGLALKEPWAPGCVCLRGLWVIHETLCDSSPVMLMGKAEKSVREVNCYSINHKISSMLYLGEPDLIFKPKAWVAPESMYVFVEIPEDGSWTGYLPFVNPVLIAVNPPPDVAFESEEDLQCFRLREMAPPNETYQSPYKAPKQLLYPKVYIWGAALPTTRFRRVPKCARPLASGYEELVTFDDFYFHGDGNDHLPVLGCPGLRRPSCLSPEISYKYEEPKMTYWDWLKKFKNDNPKLFSSTQSPKKRRKRTVVNCEMVWHGKAYCLKSYWEIPEKILITDEQKEICYPPESVPKPKPLPKYG